MQETLDKRVCVMFVHTCDGGKICLKYFFNIIYSLMFPYLQVEETVEVQQFAAQSGNQD